VKITPENPYGTGMGKLSLYTNCQYALDLYIDDKYVGETKGYWRAGAPQCGQDRTSSEILAVGSHKVYAKDKNGKASWNFDVVVPEGRCVLHKLSYQQKQDSLSSTEQKKTTKPDSNFSIPANKGYDASSDENVRATNITSIRSAPARLAPSDVFRVGHEPGYFIYDLLPKYTAIMTSPKDYLDNDNGTFIDRRNGIAWSKQPVLKTLNHAAAIDYCKNLSYGGYHDWRLPTLEEMISLMQDKPNTRGNYLYEGLRGYSWFWTADIRTGEDSWFVNVSRTDGKLGYEKKIFYGPNYDKGFVWPVRSAK
jgi:hypothetical protein